MKDENLTRLALGLAPALLWLAATLCPASALAQDPYARAEVQGSLDLTLVRRVLQVRAREALARCYRARLAERPELSGRLVMRFAIGPDGRVSSPEPVAVPGDLDDAALAACVATVLSETRFPTSPGAVTVTWPFVFLPSRPHPPRGQVPRISTDVRRPFLVVP